MEDFRARLMRLIEYDPETGAFTWRVSQGRQSAGSAAGTENRPDGRIQIRVEGKIYRAHRLAWLIMTGEWPPEGMFLDHKNRRPGDNRWSNLRLADPAQNSANNSLRSDNTSGHRGVYYHKPSARWTAQVFKKGKAISLGYFDTVEAAVEARLTASASHYGAFAPERPLSS